VNDGYQQNTAYSYEQAVLAEEIFAAIIDNAISSLIIMTGSLMRSERKNNEKGLAS
jgi:hypothetical protein